MKWEEVKTELLRLIRNIINEYADEKDISIDAKRQFDFDNKNTKEYRFVYGEIKKKCYETIEKIIKLLYKEKGKVTVFSFSLGNIKINVDDVFKVYHKRPLFSFLIMNVDNTYDLCMVKEFGIDKRLEDEIIQLSISLIERKANIRINRWFYLSTVDSCAYQEQMNHNENIEDESRGTNVYSLGMFIKDEFGIDEYDNYVKLEKEVTNYIRENLGYSIIKNLIPNRLFGYKKNVIRELEKIRIDGLGDIKPYINFIVGDKNFSISFITAEWLFDSLNFNVRMDLTIIALGYLKSIEQLLYYIIELFVKSECYIPRYIYDKKQKVKKLLKEEKVSIEYLREVKYKLTIEDLKNFFLYEKNQHIYRKCIREEHKRHFFDLINNLQRLRNKYLHRLNLIHDEGRVNLENIREQTYSLFCFIFAIIEFSDSQLKSMQINNRNTDDYYKLCEYVNYYCQKIFYITLKDGNKLVGVGCHDELIDFDENGEAQYSGIYFNIYDEFSFKPVLINICDISRISFHKVKYQDLSLFSRIEIGRMIPCAEGVKFTGPEQVVWLCN